jgi:hypothetical protein
MASNNNDNLHPVARVYIPRLISVAHSASKPERLSGRSPRTGVVPDVNFDLAANYD